MKINSSTTVKIYEICAECPKCEGMMVLHLSGDRQVADIFAPCAACKVLYPSSSQI
jgi:hypothetical protein